MKLLEQISNDTLHLVNLWAKKLNNLDDKIILEKRNTQNRNIKQILGHMIDSATNNTHRIIHLQYQETPLIFPDYANLGVNDKWIAIQNYENEDFNTLIQTWKYTNIHIAHVIKNIDTTKLSNIWLSALGDKFSLEEMIIDYPLHLNLHLKEIEDLL
jgi:hypothetical protein